MRRKRTGGKNSAYRREKAIMTASVVLVLAAMTLVMFEKKDAVVQTIVAE